MRHLVKGSKLGRTSSHRKATLQSLCIALIREHRIQTTVTKAKELRRHIEPLITRAKVDTMNNRREAFAVLQNKLAVKALFEEIAPQIGDRPGGYTRVLKTGFRSGDAAEMALIELVDFNLGDASGKSEGGKRKRTRRGGSPAKASTGAASATAAAAGASTSETVIPAVSAADVVVQAEAADVIESEVEVTDVQTEEASSEVIEDSAISEESETTAENKIAEDGENDEEKS